MKSLILRLLFVSFLFSGISAGIAEIAYAQDIASGEVEEVYDPFEGFNRAMFWFNDQVDTYVLGPVSQGYDYVMPDVVQEGVTNFFDNLMYPIRLLSDVVQLDFPLAGNHTMRFLINSTVGVAGLMDFATDWGYAKKRQDLGSAFASYNIPAGPYLVLPFIGSTTVRDGIGKIGDTFVHPYAIVEYTDEVRAGVMDPIIWGSLALDAVQTRANMDENIKTAKESSVDYYLFVQSAYYQYRAGLLKNKDANADTDFEDDSSFDFSGDYVEGDAGAAENELAAPIEGEENTSEDDFFDIAPTQTPHNNDAVNQYLYFEE